MSIVKVNGINIYYEIHGKGEPLVLISGYGSNSASWFHEVPVFSKQYRVITFDNRGTGRSDKSDVPYTAKMMADDVAGLLATIGVDAAHIYGVSMGGGIAQEFALNYPEKVISLILGCTNCGGTHAIPGDPAVVSKLVSMGGTGMTEESVRALMTAVYTEEVIKNNSELIEELIKRRLEYPTPIHTYIREAQASAGFDVYDRLPQIKAPTLIINGTEDKIVPVENARIIASRIPNAELAIIEKAGHVYNFGMGDKPDKVVLDFLRRHHRTTM